MTSRCPKAIGGSASIVCQSVSGGSCGSASLASRAMCATSTSHRSGWESGRDAVDSCSMWPTCSTPTFSRRWRAIASSSVSCGRTKPPGSDQPSPSPRFHSSVSSRSRARMTTPLTTGAASVRDAVLTVPASLCPRVDNPLLCCRSQVSVTQTKTSLSWRVPMSLLQLEDHATIQREIRALAAEKNAVILAHNYQVPEVQAAADFTGDSLGLSRQAAATDADVIVFCGVHFMAETASILAPDKTVLIPDEDAGCSLADSITAEQLRAWKAKHPGAVVVMYVNTSAEVKAKTDYCCTSSNAVQVVEHILREYPGAPILFGPDMFLGAYVEKTLGIKMHVWDGDRRHRDRHAPWPARGRAGHRVHRGERARGVPLHEDDHAAQAARLAARRPRSGQGARARRRPRAAAHRA